MSNSSRSAVSSRLRQSSDLARKPFAVRAFACSLLIAVCSQLSADEIAIEKLGVVERQARIGGSAISPATDRYPCRLLISFASDDGTWIVNLQNGTSRRTKAASFKDDYLQWPSFIGADGKVFTSCGRGGLSIYDPVTDSINLVRPISEARWLRGMAIGPAGGVYVSDYPTGSAAMHDPRTGKVTNFGRQGGPFTITHVYGYSVGCDGRHVYTAAGKIPWYVVAFDTSTGKQKNLLQFEPADHPEIHQRGNIVFLDVKHGSPEKGKPSNSYYRLVDGRVEPVESVPRFDDSYVPGKKHPQPKVEPLGRNLPIVKGAAAIRYQLPEREWTAARIPVSGQNMTVERIAPLADGRLLVSTGPYGNVHLFDTKTGSFTPVGNPAAKHVYDMQEIDGRKYFCGYPNASFGAFDNGVGTVIGNWHDSLRSKHSVFIVKGADGRIYSGNHNERESTGGALGWYDPESGKFGGIHFPNDDCEYLTTALDGKLIVYASDFSIDPTHPEVQKRDGKLIIYDTARQTIVRKITPLSDGSAGVVVETEPGVLFGVGRHNKLPVMYSVTIETGQINQRKPLPAKAIRVIARGPDGRVYLFVGGMLVRVDPKTFDVESLCSTEPGRMVFIGNDLYLAGTSELRRVVNIAAP